VLEGRRAPGRQSPAAPFLLPKVAGWDYGEERPGDHPQGTGPVRKRRG
jgi:hypothetical protein